MLTRNLVMPLAVAGAVGIPFLLSSTDNPSGQGRNEVQQAAAGLPPAGWSGGAGVRYFPGSEQGPDFSAGPLEFLPSRDLSRVFSFGVEAASIRQQFPRVSVVPGDNGWQGMRTELVTGTGPQDLHGCVTWYFDPAGTVGRIAFRGWTGDVAPLREYLASAHGMRPQGRSGWSEVLVAQSWGQPLSAAIIQQAGVIQQDQPQQQVAVCFELNRAAGGASLSAAFREMLAAGSLR